jgi:hypothetical protein
LNEKSSLNPNCSILYEGDIEKFKSEISKICEESKNESFNTCERNINTRMLLDKIKTKNSEANLNPTDKLVELTRWFINSYTEIIKADQ